LSWLIPGCVGSSTSVGPSPPPLPHGKGSEARSSSALYPVATISRALRCKGVLVATLLRSSFSASFTRELSAMGRRAELHQASVKVATRPKNKKPETVRSRFLFLYSVFLDLLQTGQKPRLGHGLVTVSV